jgi:hypothetical protein
MEYGFGDGETYDLSGDRTYDPQKEKKFRPGREYRDDLAARWEAYQNAIASGDLDALGIPWSEQQQAIGAAAQQASAGQQAAVSELNRGALAGQAFQAGAFAKAAENISDRGEQAAAQTSASMADLSQKLVEQRANQLRLEMMAQRDHNEELVNQYLQMLLDTGVEVQKALTGGGE